MAEINFYLRDSKAERKTGLLMFISYNNTRVKIGTVENIVPKFWDAKKQRAKQSKDYKEYPEFNSRVDKLQQIALDIYRKYRNDNEQKEPSKELIKELILIAFKPNAVEIKKTEPNLLNFTEQFILDSENGKRLNDKGTPIQYNTIKVYKTFKQNLIDFKSQNNYNLKFENINYEFFEDFKEWMTFTKLYSTNTLAKHIRILKVIINEAIDKGFTEKAFTGNRFKAKTELTDTVYLNRSELNILQQLDLANKPKLDKVRDLFLVGCWTGLRFSDFSNIKPSYINNGFITIKTQKTSKEVIIPIHPILFEIMAKYEGKTENSLPPTISNQKMNEYLKEIAELANFNEITTQTFTKAGKTVNLNIPKHKLITCHTSRRSFATNMFLDGVSPITIMAITGHTKESNFMRYIRVTSQEHADKLQAIWRKDLMKVV